jgi:SAM-dependent methyltransferase
MINKSAGYTTEYFESEIFETDYHTLASVIIDLYHPTAVIEFGCGPGHLSRELAKLGVKVLAVDGFSTPDFTGLSVEFQSLDLNDSQAIAAMLTNKYFDLAISVEVAEHLLPESSSSLVQWLTQVAPIVIFSAAVPEQGGHGHINLQPREYWHQQFLKHNFIVADRVREKLRVFSQVAPWYRYNVLDYIHQDHLHAPQSSEVIHRLIASESSSATAYYRENTRWSLSESRLRYAPVQWYLKLRQFGKRVLGRK